MSSSSRYESRSRGRRLSKYSTESCSEARRDREHVIEGSTKASWRTSSMAATTPTASRIPSIHLTRALSLVAAVSLGMHKTCSSKLPNDDLSHRTRLGTRAALPAGEANKMVLTSWFWKINRQMLVLPLVVVLIDSPKAMAMSASSSSVKHFASSGRIDGKCWMARV